MNWILIWALVIALGLIIGNIMMVKHTAKMKMPSLKNLKPTVTSEQAAAEKNNSVNHPPAQHEQKKNTPE